MLHSLDILIGFASIMLLVSAAVTVMTQAVTGALGWRGRNLVRGLVTILNQVDPKITAFCARQIVLAVVRHPLIARAEGKPGTVIQREELTRILLELAAAQEPGGKLLDEYARATLKRTLETNGIADAGQVLANIHLLGLKLEALRPECPAAVRHGMAIATEAPGQFTARLHACFDETMDRVTQRFARHTHAMAAGIALIVAAGLQLDAFDLLRHANTSVLVPENWEWSWAKLPGIGLSAILLSLGAPFWYNALKDLLGLRPLLARKEQTNREQRQSAQNSAGTPATIQLTGEKGDLASTGAVG